jgi:hypothetical protein
MEYAPLEKRPDQPETNQRTDVARFVGDTYIPAAEPEYGSVWPYMPGMHVGSGMGRSEMEAMFWQAHFGRSSGNPLLDALNPFASPLEETESGGTSSHAEPSTSSTISRAPAVQPSTAEEGFPLNEAQAEKVDTALAGAGQPLPEPEKAVYEAHTGHDFSNVRVHTGAAAEEAADSIGAKAFAKGSNIVFAKDQYNPSTAEGRGLIGHELAHVAQNATGVHRAPKEKDAGWQLPEVAKKALSKLTAHLPGYDLIKIVLGKDPLTDQPVSSSPEAIVRTIVGLIPGGAELFNRLNQTKAVTDTLQWFTAEFEKLNISLPYIIGLFKQAWDEMSIFKGTDNLDILKRIFAAPVTRIKSFIVNSAGKVQEIVLKGALKLVGPAVERVYAIINKGKATLGLILADPIGFARNLMAAVGQGFKNFVSHFVGHLQKSLQSWLFGTLGKAGITLPESIDAKGIFHLALQILGLTYQNIRGLIVSKVGDGGEEAMTVAEKSVEIVEKMATEGPQAMWEEAKAELPKMRDTVIGGIIGWVRNTIIVQAVTRLLGMFTPVGAIIEAGRGIYNTIMFFVQKAEEIAEVVNSIFESITNIAQKRLAPAASYIESTLGTGLTLSIAFLAKYIGLGRIPEKIKDIIAKVKKPVDTAVGKVTGWIADKVKLIVAKIKGGIDKAKGLFSKNKEMDEWEKKNPDKAAERDRGLAEIGELERAKAVDDRLAQKDAESIARTVQRKYPVFKKIEVVDRDGYLDYLYEVNPKARVPKESKRKASEPEVDMEHILEGTVTHKVTFKGLHDIPPEIKDFDKQELTPQILDELVKYEGKNGFSLHKVLIANVSGVHYKYASGYQFIEGRVYGPQKAFKARIKIYDPIKKEYKVKSTKENSFYPYNWKPEKIKQAILSAWNNQFWQEGNKWKGYSKFGLEIEGFINQETGKIHGYPLF